MKDKPKAAKPRQATKAKCPEKDWNFTGVDDGELVAATYYEYAREAKPIRNFLEKLGPMPAPPSGVSQAVLNATLQTQAAARLAKRIPGCGPGPTPCLPKDVSQAQLDAVLSAQTEWRGKLSQVLPIEAFPLVLIYGALQTKLTDAWRDQPEAKRRRAAKGIAPYFPVPTGPTKKGKREQKVPLEGPFRLGPALTDIDPEEPWGIDGTGFEWLCVGIDWGRYTDTEIIDSFTRWVRTKEGRPYGSEPGNLTGRRSDRGHKAGDWRASLQRLGIMRLMHRHSSDQIIEIVQAGLCAKSADRVKYMVKTECERERLKALDDFHTLFPFLSTEHPQSREPLPAAW